MSCLFESLAIFFKHGNHQKIRNDICNYLEQNKPIIDGLETKFILSLENPNYIRAMRMLSTWGGGIEIQVACNIWRLRIIVHNLQQQRNNKIEFLPILGEYYHTIEIAWTGNNYTPLKKYSKK